MTGTLPHNAEAERIILGALLVDNTALGSVDLRPDEFYGEAHRRIYAAMLSLSEKGRPVDLVTLKDALLGSLEGVGGAAYLASLLDGVPRISNVEHWSRQVREKAMLRRLIHLGNQAVQAAHDENPAEEVIDQLYQALTELSGKTTSDGFLDNKQLAMTVFDQATWRANTPGGIIGLRTGLHNLDRKLLGIQPGTVTIVAARTGMGKSILGLQIAEAVASTGVRVAVFSLEMSGVQLMKRRLSAAASVSINDLPWAGSIEKAERLSWLAKAIPLVSRPELMISVQGVTAPRIRAACQRVKREHGLALVVVDYIQLMDSTKRHDKHHLEIKEISGALKRMAVDLDVPVIALSQLNRNPETRADKRPTVGDIADGDSIARDADVIILIHREESKPDLATLIVGKNRDNFGGDVEVRFNGHLTQFQNLDDGITDKNWVG